MAYPNTNLTSGAADPAFGGQPANRFGVPQHTFQDAQIRTLQTQVIDDQWQDRRFVRLTISSGGNAGDAIVFNTNASTYANVYTKLTAVGYTQDQTPVVGILMAGVSAGQVGQVCIAGRLAPAVSGLSSVSKGEITVDLSTGRLRLKLVGEVTVGYCASTGDCFLMPSGWLL